MAKITYGSALGSYGWLEDIYDMNALKLVSKSASKVVYRDDDGDRIVLTGNAFSFNGKFATNGTVTGAQFLDGAGKKYLTISKASLEASDVASSLKAKDFWELLGDLTSGKDVIRGTNGSDDIIGAANKGEDKIYGLGGDDYLRGSPGSNSVDGGSGWDTLSYTSTTWDERGVKGGITVDVAKGTVKNPWGGKESFKNIEGFDGTNLNDIFRGGKENDAFTGLRGKDKFLGGKGDEDEVRYHKDEQYDGKHGIVADLAKGTIRDGFGTIDTVNSIERVYGTYFDDVFKGNGGENFFRGLDGTDSFDGRGGRDTVSFYWWEDLGQTGVVVDLSKNRNNILDDGFGNQETAKGIENIDGSQFGDTIALGNRDGYAWGDDGDDRLVAGEGESWLGGGEGADTFVFLSAKDSTSKKTDLIDDFSRKQGDRMDVSEVAEFHFIGKAKFSGEKGELNYAVKSGDTLVYGDVNGDRIADFALKLEGKHTLAAGDFIL